MIDPVLIYIFHQNQRNNIVLAVATFFIFFEKINQSLQTLSSCWLNIFYLIVKITLLNAHDEVSLFLFFLKVLCLQNFKNIPMLYRNLIKYYSSKICKSPQQALSGLKSGHTVLMGGFGIAGIPNNLIYAISQMKDIKDLTVISNDGGAGQADGSNAWGIEFLFKKQQIKRMVSSFLGYNKHYEALYLSGAIQLQFCPQGSLAEKIRAGVAGIPAFYTHTGVDTLVEKGGIIVKYKPGTNIPQILSQPKSAKVFKGKKYLMQQSYYGDFSLVKAKKADKYGNLVFNHTARNFNQDMCGAADITVAEVEEIVQNGQINPNEVHVPGVLVQRIFKLDPQNPYSQKKIQRLKYSTGKQQKVVEDPIRMKIATRAAKQVKNGMNINLGIGIPTLLPQALPKDVKINLHAENGVLGAGPYPLPGKQDPDLINAGKETITVLPGASFFPSSKSFSIIRGGHLDITMLGAMQVSREGDISNWMIPGKKAKGMGGAMDLVASGSKVIVTMQHSAKGTPKLVNKCTLPLTAKGKATLVVTEKAVFQLRMGRLVMTEIAEGLTLEQVQAQTEFQIEIAGDLKTF